MWASKIYPGVPVLDEQMQALRRYVCQFVTFANSSLLPSRQFY